MRLVLGAGLRGCLRISGWMGRLRQVRHGKMRRACSCIPPWGEQLAAMLFGASTSTSTSASSEEAAEEACVGSVGTLGVFVLFLPTVTHGHGTTSILFWVPSSYDPCLGVMAPFWCCASLRLS